MSFFFGDVTPIYSLEIVIPSIKDEICRIQVVKMVEKNLTRGSHANIGHNSPLEVEPIAFGLVATPTVVLSAR